MSKLLFFSRVAFLCNCCFVIAYLLKYLPAIANGVVPSTIIVMGTVVAIVLNVLINLLYVMIVLAGKPLTVFVPKWVIAFNFLFFFAQVILLLR